MIQRRNSDLDFDERFTRESNRLPQKDLARLADAYRDLLDGIGEDLDREGLRRTPDRAARALEFLTQGYRQDLGEIINDAVFESDASEIILVKDIELYSLCEHHLLPFIGRAHVAYIPNGKVIGLSKVARIVDVFARRLQIQENLTTQIAESLMKCLEFSASRRLFVRDWTKSENLIAFGPETEAYHGSGRNYVASFVFTGPVDSATGMLINISEIKERAGKIVRERFDHRFLNEDNSSFRDLPPTAD